MESVYGHGEAIHGRCIVILFAVSVPIAALPEALRDAQSIEVTHPSGKAENGLKRGLHVQEDG